MRVYYPFFGKYNIAEGAYLVTSGQGGGDPDRGIPSVHDYEKRIHSR